MSASVQASDLKPKQSILIVDDVPENIKLLSLILRYQEYRIYDANDGISALAIAQQMQPDLILLDVLMPEMNGFRVCELLKGNEATRNIPVIFVSALTTISEKVEAFSVGGIDYISKPFELTEVLARVQTHLRAHGLQQELEQKNQQLQVSAKALFESLEKERYLSDMKSNFISIVSHEFRTPLAAIQSSAELLQHYEWSRSEQIEQLQQIQTQVGLMKDLMEGAFTMNQASAGKSEFCPRSLNLPEIWQTMLQEIGESVGKTERIMFKSNCAPDLLAEIDERLLRLILNNLVTNALKYSDHEIRCELDCDGENVTFGVGDRGKGIPIEDQPHIFSRFFRAKNVTNAPGTGLGLAIVQHCVELHRGKIEFQSQVGQGTIFTVTLPLASDPPSHIWFDSLLTAAESKDRGISA